MEFDGAPQVLGIDEEGREVLTWLPSEPVWPYSEEILVGVAELLRRLHDALDGFTPPAEARWRVSGTAPGPNPRVGHNDVTPHNTVFGDGAPYGFIDWELAGPRPPLYDLAMTALGFTPLRPDFFCQAVGFREPPDRARRLRTLCDHYGLDDRSGLVATIERIEVDELRALVELGRAGVSPFARYLARHEDRHLQWDLDWLRANRDELERALAS